MTVYPPDIEQHAFTSGREFFKAWPGGMQRIKGSRLRRMFLPRLSREGKRALKGNDQFVRCQLKHYDIQFTEGEYSGHGTQLLQKVLRKGRCDLVPRHILELEYEMHREWLSQCSLAILVKYPAWLMDRYFLTHGKPDPLRTITTLKVIPSLYGKYGPEGITEAVGKVQGLHCQTAGLATQIIFIGWSPARVEEQARLHVDQENHLIDAIAMELAQRAYSGRLRDIFPADAKNATPAGSYEVVCENVQSQFPGVRLTIDINFTATPGLFKASFSLGLVEGIMIICANEITLNEYCSRADRGEDPDFSDELENEDKDQPIGYKLQLKCREAGENMIDYVPRHGSIIFYKNCAYFAGVADFAGDLPKDTIFTGFKVSDTPRPFKKKWSDYSLEQYEFESMDRWRRRW